VYAEVLARETGQTVEPAKLIAPMLARFMASDRGFAKARRIVEKSDGRKSGVAMTFDGIALVA
jgi:hypothetical protein